MFRIFFYSVLIFMSQTIVAEVAVDILPDAYTERDKEVLAKTKLCIDTIENTGLTYIEPKLLKRYCRSKAWAEVYNPGRYAMRIINEKATEFNPFVITPHRHSYIMPVSYSDNFNSEAYSEVGTNIDHMKNYEAKYQISLKVPLFTSDIFVPGDSLYFGMTIQAWWQLYSEKLSRPFRETNYQPEIFYQAPLPFKPFGGNMGFELGIEHQSNGQSQLLSRSWNRIKFGILYERGDHFVAFRPWYRLPEGDKEEPLSPIGDDNPDIEDYMGHYTIDAAYAFSDTRKIAVMIRKNWRTGNGAIEINFTKPIFGRMIGLVQYFSGYGESLIDYNHKQQKIGFGIALTEIF